MQKLSISNLKPGMIVAKSIYSAEGSLLLAAGLSLTEKNIERLKQLSIVAIYIKNHYLDEIEIPEVISEQTRVKTITSVQNCFKKFGLTQKLEIDTLMEKAVDILDEVIKNRNVMIHLTDIRVYDDYTFAHSVNVCVLSVLIAVSMNYDEKRLKEIAVGALLHDIGKTAIPKEILNKPDRLTDEEMQIMKEHTKLGFEILKKYHQLPMLAKHIALSHHEKYNASGYPRGVGGSEIHEYSKIVAIADVYDALTSDRPYRKGMLPNEAYDILMTSSCFHFDPVILSIFLKHISIYPIGCTVQLNTGELAVVTNVYSGVPWRPCVKLITDRKGSMLNHSTIIDLTVNLTTIITKVLSEAEVVKLFENTNSDVC